MKLYEQDYAQWAETMADYLESGKFQELDIANLADEVRDLAKRERDRLLSSLRLILHHLLKWDYQPEKRSTSWQITILRERLHIADYLEDSPSLKQYLAEDSKYFSKTYTQARLDAIAESNLELPDACPYTIVDVMERELSL